MKAATITHCYTRGYTAGAADHAAGPSALHRSVNPYKATKRAWVSRSGCWFIGYEDGWAERTPRAVWLTHEDEQASTTATTREQATKERTAA